MAIRITLTPLQQHELSKRIFNYEIKGDESSLTNNLFPETMGPNCIHFKCFKTALR